MLDVAEGKKNYLHVTLQAMFQISSRRIICEERKSHVGWFPHSCLLVQSLDEFINC